MPLKNIRLVACKLFKKNIVCQNNFRKKGILTWGTPGTTPSTIQYTLKLRIQIHKLNILLRQLIKLINW